MNVVRGHIFPLKEVKVRDIFDVDSIYTAERNEVLKKMIALRQEFGSKYYYRDGGRVYCEVWQQKSRRTKHPYMRTALRWVFEGGNKYKKGKKWGLLLSLHEVVTEKKTNHEIVLEMLSEMKYNNPVLFNEMIELEKKRIELNERHITLIRSQVALIKIKEANELDNLF